MANETPADGHDARPNSESALCKIGNIGQDINVRTAKNVNASFSNVPAIFLLCESDAASAFPINSILDSSNANRAPRVRGSQAIGQPIDRRPPKACSADPAACHRQGLGR